MARVLFESDFLRSPASAPGLASASSVDELREHLFFVAVAQARHKKKDKLAHRTAAPLRPRVNQLQGICLASVGQGKEG